MSSLPETATDSVDSSGIAKLVATGHDLGSKPCTTCNAPALMSCPECGGAKYCSKDCQDDDWKTHKYLCRHASSMEKRTSQHFRRPLLLTASEYHPKWIWIWIDEEITPAGTSESIAAEQSRLEKNGERECLEIGNIIRRNDMRARDLENALEFHFDNRFSGEVNDSLVSITRGRLRFRRTGSILVLKREGLVEEPTKYLDMEIGDYRDAADYLTAWAEVNCDDEQWAAHWALKFSSSGTMAVLIQCKGLQEQTKCKTFTPFVVGGDEVVFSEPISPISKLVGMPLHARNYPANVRDDIIFRQENMAATFLFRACDPEKDTFGWAPWEWQQGVESAVVARADGEELDMFNVQALCDYSQNHLDDPIQNALEAEEVGDNTEQKGKVAREYFNPQAFAKFWESYSQAMAKKDTDWKDVKPPVLKAQ
ncbi:hypothetical protein MMC30_006950 [Trapelia coarctata]|nr:hypothetical protein [Trapelia coarctata]